MRKGNSGQAVFEYLILLSITVVLAVGIARTIMGGFDQGILSFGGNLEKYLKTGRLDPDVWGN